MFGLRADGVTVRPIPQLDGEPGFAEIFLDEVYVPDSDVIGEPGNGWRIAMSSAGHERGLPLRSPGRFTAAAARLARLWQQHGSPDDGIAGRVADAWIAARAYQLYGYRARQRAAQRLARPAVRWRGYGAQASLGKVFWSELDLSIHQTALELLGPAAELKGTDDSAWLDGYLFALAGPIYAGTNEIQRSLIAERATRAAAMNLALSGEQAAVRR